jgi:tetratricopeptide (TPR) repeat protein
MGQSTHKMLSIRGLQAIQNKLTINTRLACSLQSASIPTFMTEATNILKTPAFAADFYASTEAEQKILAITFTPFTHDGEAALEGSGYATEFLLHHGFDVIAIKSARNTWYQDFTDEMLRTVCEFLASRPQRYSRRVSYGSSMGGYAAIQFSKIFDVNAVLALSPQYAVDEAFDERWASAAREFEIVRRIDADALSSTCEYFVVFDPATPDSLHIEKLRALLTAERLIELETPFSGHPSAYFLAEIGVLQDMAISILREGIADHLDLNAKRHESKSYLFGLSQSLLEHRNTEAALSAIDRAIEMDAESAAFHALRAHALFELKQSSRARHAIEQAIALQSDHPEIVQQAIDLYSKLKDWPEAAALAEGLRARSAPNARLIMHSMKLHFRCHNPRGYFHTARLLGLLTVALLKR